MVIISLAAGKTVPPVGQAMGWLHGQVLQVRREQIGNLLVGYLPLLEVLPPVVGAINSALPVVGAEAGDTTWRPDSGGLGSEGSPEIMDGEVLDVTHHVGWLDLSPRFTPKQLGYGAIEGVWPHVRSLAAAPGRENVLRAQ